MVTRFVKGLLLLAAFVAVVALVVVFVPEALSPLGNDEPVHSGSADSRPPEQQGTPVLDKPANATLSHVAYVHDGDTLFLQPEGTSSRDDQLKVRLIGIDAPELRPEVECFGIDARDHLRELLPEGSAVWIASDREPVDQYGRSLLYLWTMDGNSVNLDLVQNGFAAALSIPPSNSFADQFDLAESAARQAGDGLWGYC